MLKKKLALVYCERVQKTQTVQAPKPDCLCVGKNPKTSPKTGLSLSSRDRSFHNKIQDWCIGLIECLWIGHRQPQPTRPYVLRPLKTWLLLRCKNSDCVFSLDSSTAHSSKGCHHCYAVQNLPHKSKPDCVYGGEEAQIMPKLDWECLQILSTLEHINLVPGSRLDCFKN